MTVIDLNKVVGVWMEEIKQWNFHERMELQRMLSASFERDYDETRKRA